MKRGRLLITTQAVDKGDQALGFFHSWIAALAPNFERIHVVCLKEGTHDLPHNVLVHSLGKEKGVSKVGYVINFFRYLFGLWREYDSVLIHMNQEYVLLGGKFWRLGGKRLVLWRNHKVGSFWTRVAALLSHVVCYTSPDAYVARYGNAVRMPIGIDTDLFKEASPPQEDSILFLGRLDAVKKPDVFLAAIEKLREAGTKVPVHIFGDPTPGREEYAELLKKRFAKLSDVSFGPAIPHARTPEVYASHSVYVNITPSGSFDKTIGEAMSCGCLSVVSNEALRGVLPDALIVQSDSAESVEKGIRAALALQKNEREDLRERERSFVEREHSLTLLTKRLVGILSK